jgi:glycine dehydrogenase subunit 1
MLQRTAYARARLQEIEGVELLHRQPVVREFAVKLDAPVQDVISRCRQEGVNPGYALGTDYPELGEGLLVAITEKRTRADIDRLAGALAAAVTQRPGRVGVGA